MAAIFLAGLVAWTQLPISALPEGDYPTIEVMTFYPGASPDVVASAVTAATPQGAWRLPDAAHTRPRFQHGPSPRC